jgi:DNA (cytosine-5)-methyltransferase 1
LKEAERGHGIDLPSCARIFPTPTVNGNNNRSGASENSGDGLATAAGGSLNPEWVEALMGFPRHWTDPDREPSPKAIDGCCRAWLDGSWESGIPRTARGTKDRAARLKALGNAVVPDQARVVFQAIMDAEREAGE